MNVYKFGVKPRLIQPKTIFWKPFEVKYPPEKVNPVLWKIFAQHPIILKPGQTMSMNLAFGFAVSRGVVLTSLSQHLKVNFLSLSNEVILNDVDDIAITIMNNSSLELKKIAEGEFLCHVCYTL